VARKGEPLKPARWLLAGAVGLALGSLPFLRYVHLGEPVAAHADHAPRRGGQLHMVGDHHLELVRRSGRARVFASDARRRPLQPTLGWIAFDDMARMPLSWDGQGMGAPDLPEARSLTVDLELADGTQLTWTFEDP
jgi:hypothetical protein